MKVHSMSQFVKPTTAAGTFGIQIFLDARSRTRRASNGAIEILGAHLVDPSNGNVLDGGRVMLRGAVAEHYDRDPQMHGAPIEGTACVSDDGYELTVYDGSLMSERNALLAA